MTSPELPSRPDSRARHAARSEVVGAKSFLWKFLVSSIFPPLGALYLFSGTGGGAFGIIPVLLYGVLALLLISLVLGAVGFGFVLRARTLGPWWLIAAVAGETAVLSPIFFIARYFLFAGPGTP